MSRLQRTVATNWKDQAGPDAMDRRSGKDRRKGDRRKKDVPVAVDRRKGDRRSPVDRRQCPLT
jgi:hypothetical protein